MKGIGPIIEIRLLQEFKTPEAIYNANEKEFTNVAGVGPKLANEIIKNRSLDESKRILDNVYKQNIKILTYNDVFYKDIADECPEMPTLLYYKGNIKVRIRNEPEMSYNHPALILEIVGDLVLVVPTSTSPSKLSNAYHPKKNPSGCWYYYEVSKADGFAENCTLILGNICTISQGRLLEKKVI